LPMDVKLIVEKGSNKAQVFRLRSRNTLVGRRQGCNLRIPSDSVSRRHCRLIYRDDYLTVEDLASVNGTLVNGQAIAKPTIVHPGDRLTIGSVTFEVQYQLTPQAMEKLLEEQQKEGELLPTFDASGSSLPVPIPEEDPLPVTRHVKPEPKKKSRRAKKEPEEERNPSTSEVLEGRAWQLPSGEDVRDILAQLEDE
jgi:pSer/pThr/pTyr-binding forkhead associated (FHA) protein